MDNNNKNIKPVSKGWSMKNIMSGAVMIFIGILINAMHGYIEFTYTGGFYPLWLTIITSILQWISIILIGLGFFGFWILIPAFQKLWQGDSILRGWSKKNISRGFFFIIVAIVLAIFDTLIGFTGIDSGNIPFLYYMILPIVYIALGVGILGFWILIPAFQKWRHTKYEWIAWMFLVITIILICALIYFRNVSI